MIKILLKMNKTYVIIFVFIVSLKFSFAQGSNNNLLPKFFHITKVKEFYTAEVLGKGYTFLPENVYDDEGGTLAINYERKLIELHLFRPANLRNIEDNIERMEVQDKSTVILTTNYKIILDRVYSVGEISAYSIRFLYDFSNDLNQYTKFVLLNAAAEKTELEKKVDHEAFMKHQDEVQVEIKASMGSSYSLDGRSAQSLPKPNYPGNNEGIVTIRITVDKEGKVKKAEQSAKGTTTDAQELISAAKAAAIQARFNADSNAPEYQVGTITYHFKLN